MYTMTHVHVCPLAHKHTKAPMAHAALEMVSAQYKSLLTHEHGGDLITMTTVFTT